MAIVGAALIAGGIAFATGAIATGVTTAVIGMAITTFAVTLTRGLIANARANDGETAFTAERQGSQTMVVSPVESLKILYGETVVSGVMVFAGVSGEDNNDLHIVLALAGHEVEAIGTVFLDEKPDDHEDYQGVVKVYRHLGSKFQYADKVLSEKIPEWTEAHRLRGVAYIHVIVTRTPDSPMFQQIPNIKARIRGKRVIDVNSDYTKKNVLRLSSPSSELSFQNSGSVVITGDSCFHAVIENVVYITNTAGVEYLIIYGKYGDLESSSFFVYDNISKTLTLKVGATSSDVVSIYHEFDPLHMEVGYEIIGAQVFFHVDGQTIMRNITTGGATLIDFKEIDQTFPAESIAFCTFDFVDFKLGDFSTWLVDFVAFNDTVSSGVIPNHGSYHEELFADAGTSASFAKYDTTNPEEYHRVWSKNAALNILDYMMEPRFGLALSFDEIDLVSWGNSATACGVQVFGSKDPCPRSNYPLDGVADTRNAIGNNIASMVSSCGGTISWSHGKFCMNVAYPVTPTMTITEDMINSEIQFTCVQPLDVVFNSVKCVYVSAVQQWQTAETVAYIDAEAVTEDIFDNEMQLNLPFTDNDITAQRLGRIYLNLSRLEKGLIFTTNHETYGLKVKDVVLVNSPSLNIIDKQYEVSSHVIEHATADDVGGINIVLTEYDPLAFDIPIEEILPPSDLPDTPTPPDSIAPVNDFEGVSNSSTADPVTGDPRVDLSWKASENERCDKYQIHAFNQATGTTYNIVVNGRTNITAQDTSPNDNEKVTYTIIAVRDDGMQSDESTIEVLAWSGAGVPPAPSNFTVVSTESNAPSYGDARWDAPVNPDRRNYVLRLGRSWEESEFLHENSYSGASTVQVTGFGFTHFIASRMFDGQYSEPSQDTATPFVDSFDPAYIWGDYEWQKNGVPYLLDGAMIHPVNKKVVNISNSTASDNYWQTFDAFIDNANSEAFISFAEFPLVEGNEIKLYAGVFSSLDPMNKTALAKNDVKYRVRNNGVWGNWYSFQNAVTFKIIGLPLDELLQIGAELIYSNSTERKSIMVDSYIRIGANVPL